MGTKFGARSLRTLCDTCSEFVSGSTETSTPSTELPSQLDLKRPDDSDTRPLRASSFTESRSAEVDERSQFPREPPWVRTPPTSTSRSFSSTPTTTPSATTPRRNGSPRASTSTGKYEASPPLASTPEVSARVTRTPTPSVAPPAPPGRDETPFDSDESDKHRVLGTFVIEGSYTNLPDFYCELFNKKGENAKKKKKKKKKSTCVDTTA